jgi:transcriptional regulator with XRE-family HTH domain
MRGGVHLYRTAGVQPSFTTRLMSRILKQQAVGTWVRRLREDAGMSLRALASRTGFSPSFMSQVENGLVSPSLGSMAKIADAVGVSLGEFFRAAAGGAPAFIVRAGDRLRLPSSWSHGQIEALGLMEGRRLEPVLITLASGGRSGKHPSSRPAEEFAFVLEGTLSFTLGAEQHALVSGDSVTIRPNELRLWENHSLSLARVVVVSALSASGRFEEPAVARKKPPPKKRTTRRVRAGMNLVVEGRASTNSRR